MIFVLILSVMIGLVVLVSVTVMTISPVLLVNYAQRRIIMDQLVIQVSMVD